MAIRAAGSYVSKSKGAKRGRKSGKENKFSKNKFYNLVSRLFPVTQHGTTSHPKVRSRQDLNQYLIGRTFKVNQGDLECKDPTEAQNSMRYFKFKVNKVVGNDCQSVFDGMEVVRDKVSGMIRKWHTLIEAHYDFTTKDGSTWRVFVNAVTKKNKEGSLKSYAQASSVKEIRKIILETLEKNLEGLDMEKLVKLLSTDQITRDIESKAAAIYPVNTMITKVKSVKNMQCIVMRDNKEEDKEEAVNEFIKEDE